MIDKEIHTHIGMEFLPATSRFISQSEIDEKRKEGGDAAVAAVTQQQDVPYRIKLISRERE